MLRLAVIKAIRESYDNAENFRANHKHNREYVRGQLELAVNLLGLDGAPDTEAAMENIALDVFDGWDD